jgi:hypothetical protein
MAVGETARRNRHNVSRNRDLTFSTEVPNQESSAGVNQKISANLQKSIPWIKRNAIDS